MYRKSKSICDTKNGQCFRAPPKCLKVGFQGSPGPFQGSRAPLSSPVIRTLMLTENNRDQNSALHGSQI